MTSLESIEELRNHGVLDFAPNIRRKVCMALDEIEREIAEKYMELPVDADGVPIRVGDELENGEYRLKVTDMSWDGHYWHVYHGSIAFALCDCTHVKPRTVEDVLVEFYGEFAKAKYGEDSEVLSHYADELRDLIKEGEL